MIGIQRNRIDVEAVRATVDEAIDAAKADLDRHHAGNHSV